MATLSVSYTQTDNGAIPGNVIFSGQTQPASGRLDSVGATLGVSAGSHLTSLLSWSRSHADLPGGSFTGDLYSLRFGWAFSTRLTASAFVQYNDLDDEWITNLRLNLIHRPGSDLFVVYNEEREEGTVVDRRLVVKLTWLVRF